MFMGTSSICLIEIFVAIVEIVSSALWLSLDCAILDVERAWILKSILISNITIPKYHAHLTLKAKYGWNMSARIVRMSINNNLIIDKPIPHTIQPQEQIMVWYSVGQIFGYLNIFEYIWTNIFIGQHNHRFIWIFFRDLFIVTNIFRYSFFHFLL